MGWRDRLNFTSLHLPALTSSSAQEYEAHAIAIEDGRMAPNYEQTASSQVPDGIYRTGVYPIPPFMKRYEFYDTVGKVQTAVDGFVKSVMKREFYFESDEENDDRGVKLMDKWVTRYHWSWLMEYIMRDWLVAGNCLIGLKDWMPVQIISMSRMIRDNYGNVEKYIQVVAGSEVYLDPKDFLHTKFIDTNREPWARGMFHSLMTSFVDIDGRIARPTLEIYRQMQQDVAKIHHKYASPRVFYMFDNVNPITLDNLSQVFRNVKPGDRQTVNRKFELVTETVDGRARFTESIEWLNGEVEAGLQSSRTRLITKPSAMADAREANKADDDTVLDLMEKIRRLMDEEIIPRVLANTGIDPETIHFKWGAADSFELHFPPGLAEAVKLNLISEEEAREILKSTGWQLDDNKWQAYLQKKQTQNPFGAPDVTAPQPSLPPNGKRKAKAKGNPDPSSPVMDTPDQQQVS